MPRDRLAATFGLRLDRFGFRAAGLHSLFGEQAAQLGRAGPGMIVDCQPDGFRRVDPAGRRIGVHPSAGFLKQRCIGAADRLNLAGSGYPPGTFLGMVISSG
ncbi:MAG: hypothetical protein WD847_10550 [Pirellulales bacterium]